MSTPDPNTAKIEKHGRLVSYRGGKVNHLLPSPRESQKAKVGDKKTQAGGGKRQPAQGHGRRTAKAMRDYLLSRDSDGLIEAGIYHVSLTFPPNLREKSPSQWKEKLRGFVRKITRKYGECGFVWRLEITAKDGSYAPHFHLLLVSPLDKGVKGMKGLKGKVEDSWSGFTTCRRITAKEGWAGLDALFNYINKKEETLGIKTGKTWGIRNEEYLDTFKHKESSVLTLEQYEELRGVFARVTGKNLGEALYPMKMYLPHDDMVDLREELGLEVDRDRSASNPPKDPQSDTRTPKRFL